MNANKPVLCLQFTLPPSGRKNELMQVFGLSMLQTKCLKLSQSDKITPTFDLDYFVILHTTALGKFCCV